MLRGGPRLTTIAAANALPDTDPDAAGQLYNLSSDPGETTNLSSQHPEVVQQLKSLLDASKQSGRSAPIRR